MFNLIRADMYRILRGKGLYITFAVLLVVNIFVFGMFNAAETGVIDFGGEEVVEIMGVFGLTGSAIPASLSGSMDNIVWFMLAVIMLVAASIFDNNTVKNDVAWGMCRIKLYMSKLILSAIICVALMLFYIGTGMLIATVVNGFGGPVYSGYWMNMLQVFLAQLLLMLGVTSVGIFLVFTTKRSGLSLGLYIAFLLVPMVVIQLLVMANSSWEWLAYYDLPSSLNMLVDIRYMETNSIIRALGLGAFYLFGGTILGVVLFRRAEIK